jgi:hypothetical protein
VTQNVFLSQDAWNEVIAQMLIVEVVRQQQQHSRSADVDAGVQQVVAEGDGRVRCEGGGRERRSDGWRREVVVIEEQL